MKDDDIYILYKPTVPTILIETGYMSNYKDLDYLRSEDSVRNSQREFIMGLENLMRSFCLIRFELISLINNLKNNIYS